MGCAPSNGDRGAVEDVIDAVVPTDPWQQISVGKHRAGARVDVHVTDELLQISDGADLLKTAVRSDPGKEIRGKKAFTMPQRGA